MRTYLQRQNQTMKFKFNITTLSLSLAAIFSSTAIAENFEFKGERKSSEIIVAFQSGENASESVNYLNKATDNHIAKVLADAEFKGEKKQQIEVLSPTGIDAKKVIIIGLGDSSALQPGDVNKIGANIYASINKSPSENVSIYTKGINDAKSNASFAAELAHGINLRAYKFDKYLSEKKPAEKTIAITVDEPKSAKANFNQLEAIEKGVFLARDLTSEVPTEMNPVHFAKAAKELKDLGVKVKILKPKEIKKLGMGALHAVGRGSQEGSRLVVAHWKGSDDAPIALVGKGITFDSGGYNIKATGTTISRMKSDMAGAAAVLGTVKAMALQKAKVNVVAVMPMAANMVSATSVAPGDVAMTGEGLSVEILNTDAEGRLVLADGMWYARKYYKPSVMVDIATLTGSKVRALGNRYTAIFSEDDTLIDQFTNSGKAVDELVWRLPLAYDDLLKSPIADLKNSGFGGPGATTAAVFLQQFTGDTKWAHLDIAGNALAAADKGVTPAGGTGHGVRLLSHWLLENKVK